MALNASLASKCPTDHHAALDAAVGSDSDKASKAGAFIDFLKLLLGKVNFPCVISVLPELFSGAALSKVFVDYELCANPTP